MKNVLISRRSHESLMIIVSLLLLANISSYKIIPHRGLIVTHSTPPMVNAFGGKKSSIRTSSYEIRSATSDSESVSKTATVPFLNIANVLTISRVIAIPFFMLSFVMRRKSIGVLIYIASCLTDYLDGYLARKLKLTSPFGAFLDPVADKLMVATALIMLVCQLPTWWFACPVALIMCREIGVSALREWMAEKGQRSSVQVGNLGKVKTTTQMIATAMLLEACPGSSNFDIAVSLGISRPILFSAGVVLLYIATLLTVISGVQYLVAAWPTLTENPTQKSGDALKTKVVPFIG